MMEEWTTVLALLQASGGVGIWVLVYVVWRFDRRLYRLEVQQEVLLSALPPARQGIAIPGGHRCYDPPAH